MRIDTRQNHTHTYVLRGDTAAYEKSESGGVDVGYPGKVQDHSPGSGVSEILHFLAEKGPNPGCQKLAAQANNRHLILELNRDSHRYLPFVGEKWERGKRD